MRKAAVVSGLRAQRQATLDLLTALPADRWSGEQVDVCPRQVAAILAAVDEAAATGRILLLFRRTGSVQALHAWRPVTYPTWLQRSREELLEGLRVWGERLASRAGRTPVLLERIHLSGPYGRQPLLYLLCRRILDEWVRVQLLAAALDGEPETGPAVQEALASAVLDSLPALVLRRMSRTTGVIRLVVSCDPASEHRMTWGVDFARKQYGPRVSRAPDALVRLTAPALAALSQGLRLSSANGPRPGMDVEGDRGLATDFLDAVSAAAWPRVA